MANNWNISPQGNGFNLSHSCTPFENNNHKLSSFVSVENHRGFGSEVNTGAQFSASLIDTTSHRLGATVGASQNIIPHGVTSTHAGLDYAHKPSGLSGFASATHHKGFGTDVNAGAKLNFVQDKNCEAGVSGQYGRHFGGPGGASKPNYGAGIFYKHNF